MSPEEILELMKDNLHLELHWLARVLPISRVDDCTPETCDLLASASSLLREAFDRGTATLPPPIPAQDPPASS